MPATVVARTDISRNAEQAARMYVDANVKPINPWPAESDAGRAWKASLERWLLAVSAEEGEDSPS